MIFSRSKKKASPETETMGIGEPQPNNATGVSSDAGAKVLKNIDLASSYIPKERIKYKKGVSQRVIELKNSLLLTSKTYSEVTLSSTKVYTLYQNPLIENVKNDNDTICFMHTNSLSSNIAN